MRNGLRFGEVILAGDAATGIIFDRYDNVCEARLDGECIRSHAQATVCARWLAMQGVHLVWSFVSDKPAGFVSDRPRGFVAAPPQRPQPPQTAKPAALPVAPVKARPAAAERETKGRARCAWYRAIRRAYGCAQGAGLDTKADAAMRAAIGAMLGRSVASRSELSAGEWLSVGDGIRRGEVAW
jgi:hypothetical protein